MRRATEYHNNERRPLHISRHFCTLSRIVSCPEPCILALVACLLPPAVVACYICCCCSPCENQARGRSGFGGHSGEDSEHQSLRFSFVALWSTNPPSLHVAKIPIGVATNGCGEWGDAHPYVRSGRSFLVSYEFPTSVEPFTPVLRDTPSSATLLGPVSK